MSNKYSEEELIEEIQRVSEEHCEGETPTQRDMAEYGKFAYTTYRKRFGSWNESVEMAGFEPNKGRFKTDDERILAGGGRGIVENLPKSEIIEMHFREGMKLNEIAEELDCSQGSIQKRLTDFPTIRSSDARKVLYFGRVEKSSIGQIAKSTKYRLGIVEEDNEYTFDPVFAQLQEVRELAEEGVFPMKNRE
jgi:hypothetical protein